MAAAAIALVLLVGTLFALDRLSAGPEEETLASYVDSPGYERFLRGRLALGRGQSMVAERHLRNAIAADSELAPARVALARVNAGLRRQGWHRIDEAREQAERAVAIDPQLAEAQLTLAAIALYYYRDHRLAAEKLAAAHDLVPNEPNVLVVQSYLHIILGEEKQALAAISRAHRIEPLSPRLNADYGWILYKAGNWNAAERMCRNSLELDPRSEFALECVIHVNHSQGEYAEAAEHGLRLMRLRGASEVDVAQVRAITDPRERERTYWRWMLSWLEENEAARNDGLSKQATALLMAGQRDEAVARFDHAFDHGGEAMLAFFAVDPRVEELRSHPEFARLAERSRTAVKPAAR